jgi:hypothetical protein
MLSMLDQWLLGRAPFNVESPLSPSEAIASLTDLTRGRVYDPYSESLHV